MPGEREESVAARGDDDFIIRYERATKGEFTQTVTIKIDGEPVTAFEATPVTDDLGNEKLGPDGNRIPRPTTLYDAARQLVRDGRWTQETLDERIPVLCHQTHVNPVGMCRMCSVQITAFKKRTGRFDPNPKLVPACQHRVKNVSEVFTRGDPSKYGESVRKATRVLGELLRADCYHPDPTRDDRFRDELKEVTERVGATATRFHPGPTGRDGKNHAGRHDQSRPIPLDVVPLPYSSRTVQVDHDRCILCDRCAAPARRSGRSRSSATPARATRRASPSTSTRS